MKFAVYTDAEPRNAQIAKSAKSAASVVGSLENAEHWLNAPALALGGCKPVDVTKTPQGFKMVADVIGRLEHGVYT